MNNESKANYHITDRDEFNQVCIEDQKMNFPEFEKFMHDYLLSQPKETMVFQECWIEDKQVEIGDVRTVQVNFLDHNSNNYIRLWGAKKNDDNQVVKIKVDAIDLETKEVIYERLLA
ncbi:hypothetical protein [Guptibacillus hwajinpoensis]|uniref:hypothetical protein n=1 Tax=Guptibacillus hwajinpoensis TaxID=208199 RepID=UPI001CFDEE2C|nr:hypothetical protein [Pseudalkalibacillus hwajinpoensis]WLR59200.1 hypothetical protein LC071_18975 [Pseudalkalibacillus hwajinpoensis]